MRKGKEGKREVKEELGIRIKPLKLLSPVDHLIPKEKQHWIAAPYFCQLTSGTPKLLEPDKNSDLGWFSLKEVKKLRLSLVAKMAFKQVEEKYAELSDFF